MASPEPFEAPSDAPPPARSWERKHVWWAAIGLIAATVPLMFTCQWLSNAPRFLAATGLPSSLFQSAVDYLVTFDMLAMMIAVFAAKILQWTRLGTSSLDEW